MPWFAIRCVYLFGVTPADKSVFEERVVVFEAASTEEAHAKGDAESDAYAQQFGYVAHQELRCYELDDMAASDGAEVWSELFEDDCSLPEFYAKRYAKFEYSPVDVRRLSCPL